MNRLTFWIRYRFARRARMQIGAPPWIYHIDAVLHDFREAGKITTQLRDELDAMLKDHRGDPDDDAWRVSRRLGLRRGRASTILAEPIQ